MSSKIKPNNALHRKKPASVSLRCTTPVFPVNLGVEAVEKAALPSGRFWALNLR